MSLFDQYLDELNMVNESVSARNIKLYLTRFFEHFQKLVYIRSNYNSTWASSIFQSSRDIRENYNVVKKDIIEKQIANKTLNDTYTEAIKIITSHSECNSSQIPKTRPEFLTFEFIKDKDQIRNYLISSITNNPNTDKYASHSDEQIINEINKNCSKY